jgi:hypothetical protein
VESSCEFGIEPSRSIKCWETIKYPNIWRGRAFEWCLAPESYYITTLGLFKIICPRLLMDGARGSVVG